jgi:hypothetical protein
MTRISSLSDWFQAPQDTENSLPIEERTFHSAAAHRPASWAGYPTHIFLESSWIFLEYTESFWDILQIYSIAFELISLRSFGTVR